MRVKIGRLLVVFMVSLIITLTGSMVCADDNTSSATGYLDIDVVNGVIKRINRAVTEEGTGNTILTATSYTNQESGSVACGGVLLGRAIGSVSGGTGTATGAVNEGDRLGFMIGRGYDGSNWQNSAGFTIKVDGTVSSGSVPARFVIETGTTYSDRKERLVVKYDGKVGIGNTSPSYNLDVAGDINFTGNLYQNGSIFSSGGSTGGSTNSMWSMFGTDVYYSSGNVGIGTSSPDEALHVEENGDSYIKVQATTGSGQKSGIKMQRGEWESDVYSDWSIYNSSGILYFDVYGQGTTTNPVFVIEDKNGNVGIGTSNPTADLHIQQSDGLMSGKGGIKFGISTITYGSSNWKIYHSGSHFSFSEKGTRRAYISSSTGSYVTVSDKSFKKNIEAIGCDKVLQGVMQLRPTEYHYKGQDNSMPKNLGFIAQEVEAVFPSLVKIDEEGNKGLAYDDFAVIAIAAIKELKAENDTLKEELTAENCTIKAENKQLRDTLVALADRQKTLEDMFFAISSNFSDEKLAMLNGSAKAVK